MSTKTPFSNLVEGDEAVSWVKPQGNTIKMAVDAAMFNEYNYTGARMVARDATCELLQARTVRTQGLFSSEMAEIMGIKEAVSWMKQRGWRHVVIESDCLVTVQAVGSKIRMISPFVHLVEDCRTMLFDLNTVSLFFIKRSANMTVHELARASLSRIEFLIGFFVSINVKNVLVTDASF